MNITFKNSVPLDNAYLKLLLTDLSVYEVIDVIDIESIEDHTAKVIFRTIKGSVEAINEYLDVPQKEQVSISN